MDIETTELLEFFIKAKKLEIFDVDVSKNDNGYRITLRHDWDDSFRNYDKTFFITNEGKSSCDYGDHTFYLMNEILDKMLIKEEQKIQKAKEERKKLYEELKKEFENE